MALRLASEPAYSSGRIRFVTRGENVTPANRDMTGKLLARLESVWTGNSQPLTGFGKIKPLFEEIRDQPEQRDEASQHRTYDVEVCDGQDRHIVVKRSRKAWSESENPVPICRVADAEEAPCVSPVCLDAWKFAVSCLAKCGIFVLVRRC